MKVFGITVSVYVNWMHYNHPWKETVIGKWPNWSPIKIMILHNDEKDECDECDDSSNGKMLHITILWYFIFNIGYEWK